MDERELSSYAWCRDRYAIVGVGETAYMRGSGRTTRSLGAEAVGKALADAGLRAAEVDGMLAYHQVSGDSTLTTQIAGDLGIRPDFHMDVLGGGSTTEALIAMAIGLIQARQCSVVVIYRAMNGYSQSRPGGGGLRSLAPVVDEQLHTRAFGLQTAAQQFAFSFMRHMHEFGTRPEQVATVKAIHSEHASCNPKALYRRPVTVQDVLASRMICQPLHLLDCCVESDNATALVLTSSERARDLRAHPVLVRAVVGRCCKPRVDMHYQHGPITTTAGAHAQNRLWSLAGLGPQDVDLTGAYDAFTFTVPMQLEDYGFCRKGEGGAYVSDGTMRLGGARPNNTSGGLLCEGYTHGLSLVIENVRQLRHDADDGCPVGPDGRRRHTFDHRVGGCRQVRGAEVSLNMGWGQPAVSSALVLRRG